MRSHIAAWLLAAGIYLQKLGYRIQPVPKPARRGRPRKAR